ncbi:hypothetical protein DAH66_06315 [Sphingomonas koreensis]|uniref:Uncharacterized protein n=1 Tax=Sphingomonas koreensis TaxID=93064 RepID=A0A430G654_9SPHN|nr:hypothetical protein DAH66_06315 [Sphingomonas koreensis]
MGQHLSHGLYDVHNRRQETGHFRYHDWCCSCQSHINELCSSPTKPLCQLQTQRQYARSRTLYIGVVSRTLEISLDKFDIVKGLVKLRYADAPFFLRLRRGAIMPAPSQFILEVLDPFAKIMQRFERVFAFIAPRAGHRR